MKLTKATIAKLPVPDPSGKQRLHWDDEVKGFGILCSGVTDAKTYIVQRGVNGRKRRVTLGRVEEYERAGKTVSDARADAANLLLDMRAGNDPRARSDANPCFRRERPMSCIDCGAVAAVSLQNHDFPSPNCLCCSC